MSTTTRPALGCCVDRKYGKGCTDDTCMNLPAGTTCGDCAHLARCTGMGFTRGATETACDFFPRRFRVPTQAEKDRLFLAACAERRGRELGVRA